VRDLPPELRARLEAHPIMKVEQQIYEEATRLFDSQLAKVRLRGNALHTARAVVGAGISAVGQHGLSRLLLAAVVSIVVGVYFVQLYRRSNRDDEGVYPPSLSK
jgi:hypothetical protein